MANILQKLVKSMWFEKRKTSKAYGPQSHKKTQKIQGSIKLHCLENLIKSISTPFSKQKSRDIWVLVKYITNQRH